MCCDTEKICRTVPLTTSYLVHIYPTEETPFAKQFHETYIECIVDACHPSIPPSAKKEAFILDLLRCELILKGEKVTKSQ